MESLSGPFPEEAQEPREHAPFELYGKGVVRGSHEVTMPEFVSGCCVAINKNTSQVQKLNTGQASSIFE
jgi:hypothetical protein